jgi:hypothetical protein
VSIAGRAHAANLGEGTGNTTQQRSHSTRSYETTSDTLHGYSASSYHQRFLDRLQSTP